MTATFRMMVVVSSACAVLAAATTAQAGPLRASILGSDTADTHSRPGVTRVTASDPARPGDPGLPPTWAAVQPKRQGMNPAAIGAIIGAGAAVGFTAAAAARYGENETGGFCSRCFVEWSVVTVPVGAGLGAAIGWGIGRARRSVTAVPLVTKKTVGVVVSARF